MCKYAMCRTMHCVMKAWIIADVNIKNYICKCGCDVYASVFCIISVIIIINFIYVNIHINVCSKQQCKVLTKQKLKQFSNTIKGIENKIEQHTIR